MAESGSQPTVPTLYHLSSSQSFPVLVALEEAAALRGGLEYELKLVPRERSVAPAELKKVHPLGKSPIMIVKDRNGKEEVLSESRLLLQYISDNYTSGEWVPTSEEDKKREAFFEEFVRSTFLLKALFCVVFNSVPPRMPFGIKHIFKMIFSQIIGFFGNDLRVIYQYMEDHLSESKPWLSGHKFGLADLNAIYAMDVVVQNNFGPWEPEKYPRLAKWHTAITQMESYKKALVKGGAYNLKTSE